MRHGRPIQSAAIGPGSEHVLRRLDRRRPDRVELRVARPERAVGERRRRQDASEQAADASDQAQTHDALVAPRRPRRNYPGDSEGDPDGRRAGGQRGDRDDEVHHAHAAVPRGMEHDAAGRSLRGARQRARRVRRAAGGDGGDRHAASPEARRSVQPLPLPRPSATVTGTCTGPRPSCGCRRCAHPQLSGHEGQLDDDRARARRARRGPGQTSEQRAMRRSIPPILVRRRSRLHPERARAPPRSGGNGPLPGRRASVLLRLRGRVCRVGREHLDAALTAAVREAPDAVARSSPRS